MTLPCQDLRAVLQKLEIAESTLDRWRNGHRYKVSDGRRRQASLAFQAVPMSLGL